MRHWSNNNINILHCTPLKIFVTLNKIAPVDDRSENTVNMFFFKILLSAEFFADSFLQNLYFESVKSVISVKI